MATKKIFRIPAESRDWLDEEEARAVLHLDSQTEENKKYWAIIKKEVTLYPGGYFREHLYKAMLKHPIAKK